MRKSKPKKRILLPDPKFNDQMVTRFVNMLMYQGKKNTSYAIFYDALSKVEEKLKESGLDTWKKAMANVMPTVEVKAAGLVVQHSRFRQKFVRIAELPLSIKWLIGYARGRNEKTMADKLANEIIAASKNEGAAIKKERRYSQNGGSK